MKKFLRVVSAISVFICLMLAFQAIAVNSPEQEKMISESTLPLDVFMKYRRIGYQWNVFAASYWRIVIYRADPKQWDYILKEMRNQGLRPESITTDIAPALAANFDAKPDPKRDREILDQYKRMQAAVPDLKRREEFQQRFKDMTSYVGGAAIFSVVVWLLRQRDQQVEVDH